MDDRLVAWGRAVKARCRSRVPPLWLFTDAARMDDVVAAVRALPSGLCGVVFRHDGVPGRALLLREVARACRARRLALVVAGPVAGTGAVPAGAGRHLREGHRPLGRFRFATSSAHGRAGLVRARRAGAALIFLSPAFATASHPGAPALGPWRWGAMARGAGVVVAALGGIDGRSVRRLPRWVEAVGAIGALVHHSLSPVCHSVSPSPWQTPVHDCEVKKGTAILSSGLADPEPVLLTQWSSDGTGPFISAERTAIFGGFDA